LYISADLSLRQTYGLGKENISSESSGVVKVGTIIVVNQESIKLSKNHMKIRRNYI
jgi:hypothetical protein